MNISEIIPKTKDYRQNGERHRVEMPVAVQRRYQDELLFCRLMQLGQKMTPVQASERMRAVGMPIEMREKAITSISQEDANITLDTALTADNLRSRSAAVRFLQTFGQNVGFNRNFQRREWLNDASFTGEQGAIPVHEPSYNATGLTRSSVKGAVAINMEIIRQQPNAASSLAAAIERQVANEVDRVFFSSGGATDDQPAGVFNGATDVSLQTDPGTLLRLLVDATPDADNESSVISMSRQHAIEIPLYRDANGGNIMGCDFGARGGQWLGLDVAVTDGADQASDSGEIGYCDFGAVAYAMDPLEVSATNSGTLAFYGPGDLDSNTELNTVEAFQVDCLLVRFVQPITWAVVRPDAIAYGAGDFR